MVGGTDGEAPRLCGGDHRHRGGDAIEELETALAAAGEAFARVRQLSNRVIAQMRRSQTIAPRLSAKEVGRRLWQYTQEHAAAYAKCAELCPRGDADGLRLRRCLFSRRVISERIGCKSYQIQRSPAWAKMQRDFLGVQEEVGGE